MRLSLGGEPQEEGWLQIAGLRGDLEQSALPFWSVRICKAPSNFQRLGEAQRGSRRRLESLGRVDSLFRLMDL